jgi:hypothetical protein
MITQGGGVGAIKIPTSGKIGQRWGHPGSHFHGNRNDSHARLARGTDEGVRPYTIILAGGAPLRCLQGGNLGPVALGILV